MFAWGGTDEGGFFCIFTIMENFGNIPQTLYKYRVWSEKFHKTLLTKGEIFLASPAQFNDPFDSSLPFRYIEKELTEENIFRKLLDVGRKAWPDLTEEELHSRSYERQKSGVFQNGDYWKEFHDDFKRNIHSTFGVISLTSKNDNLLMWAHYANSHKGMCIGLDRNIIYETISGTIGPVNYARHFPEMSLFDNTPANIIKMLNTKSEHWSYEDEYRLTKIHSANKVYTLPPEAITQIVLGCNMPMKEKEEIYKLRDERLPHALLFEAAVNLYEFKLDIHQIVDIKPA